MLKNWLFYYLRSYIKPHRLAVSSLLLCLFLHLLLLAFCLKNLKDFARPDLYGKVTFSMNYKTCKNKIKTQNTAKHFSVTISARAVLCCRWSESYSSSDCPSWGSTGMLFLVWDDPITLGIPLMTWSWLFRAMQTVGALPLSSSRSRLEVLCSLSQWENEE